MYNRVVYGPVNARLLGFSDINKLEFVVGGVLLLLTCVYGFLPRLLISGVECTAFKLLMQ
jgi:NADH:ubiquinone oxidoreductase subunit 4 (subunit M)